MLTTVMSQRATLSLDQRPMAFMQEAHGRHEADPQARGAVAAQALGQGFDRAEGEHRQAS